MANNLLTVSQITNEALTVLEKELSWNWRDDYLIHMKAKGKWQLCKWEKRNGEHKYWVKSEHATRNEAEAFRKLME